MLYTLKKLNFQNFSIFTKTSKNFQIIINSYDVYFSLKFIQQLIKNTKLFVYEYYYR